MRRFTGAARVAGVLGRPIVHSLSPLIHNAWIDAAGLDAVYAPFSPSPGGVHKLFEACRGGLVAGFNVTIPFKEEALAAADSASERARRAGAANLVLFADDGSIHADSTDGAGLMTALAEQAPGVRIAEAPVVVLGAGGAGRSAAAALLDAGAAEVRLVNRTRERAEAVAAALGGRVRALGWDAAAEALAGARLVVNATSLGLEGRGRLALDLASLPPEAAVVDLVYRPLVTGFLASARAGGHAVVDGLAVLIGQAKPSFEALFGRPPPAEADVRSLALAALKEER